VRRHRLYAQARLLLLHQTVSLAPGRVIPSHPIQSIGGLPITRAGADSPSPTLVAWYVVRPLPMNAGLEAGQVVRVRQWRLTPTAPSGLDRGTTISGRPPAPVALRPALTRAALDDGPGDHAGADDIPMNRRNGWLPAPISARTGSARLAKNRHDGEECRDPPQRGSPREGLARGQVRRAGIGRGDEEDQRWSGLAPVVRWPAQTSPSSYDLVCEASPCGREDVCIPAGRGNPAWSASPCGPCTVAWPLCSDDGDGDQARRPRASSMVALARSANCCRIRASTMSLSPSAVANPPTASGAAAGQ
jgi:hypothetical protein